MVTIAGSEPAKAMSAMTLRQEKTEGIFCMMVGLKF
jgi:hypothetical protein